MAQSEAREREPAVEQPFDEVAENVVGLDQAAARRVVDLLQQDIASFALMYHQYYKHVFLLEGPQFRELQHLMEMHAHQVEDEIEEFGERINLLGAVPAMQMAKQLELTYLSEEPAGAMSIRDMVEKDARDEGTIAGHLRGHIDVADEVGDFGTVQMLKRILRNAEKRAAFLDKHLRAESLFEEIPGQREMVEV